MIEKEKETLREENRVLPTNDPTETDERRVGRGANERKRREKEGGERGGDSDVYFHASSQLSGTIATTKERKRCLLSTRLSLGGICSTRRERTLDKAASEARKERDPRRENARALIRVHHEFCLFIPAQQFETEDS